MESWLDKANRKCVSQPNGTSGFFFRGISFYDSSEKLNRQIWKEKEGDNVIDQVWFDLEYVLGDQGIRALATKKLKGEQGLLREGNKDREPIK